MAVQLREVIAGLHSHVKYVSNIYDVITNNYCVVSARNDFYLSATLNNINTTSEFCWDSIHSDSEDVVAMFELSTIDLLGEPLSISIPKQFLGLWNVN